MPNLKPLFLPMAKGAGQIVGMSCEAYHFKGRFNASGILPLQLEKQKAEDAAVGFECQFKVIQDGKVFEDGGFLEFPADAEIGNGCLVQPSKVITTIEQHPTFVGPRSTRNDVKHRRLARPIGSDDCA